MILSLITCFTFFICDTKRICAVLTTLATFKIILKSLLIIIKINLLELNNLLAKICLINYYLSRDTLFKYNFKIIIINLAIVIKHLCYLIKSYYSVRGYR
jgi:hypothetical protein